MVVVIVAKRFNNNDDHYHCFRLLAISLLGPRNLVPDSLLLSEFCESFEFFELLELFELARVGRHQVKKPRREKIRRTKDRLIGLITSGGGGEAQ